VSAALGVAADYELLPNCPLCGGALEAFAVAAAASVTLHRTQSRCAGCGVLVANPRASEHARDRYYQDTYYQKQWPDAERLWSSNVVRHSRRDFSMVRELAGDLLRRGTALDLGCGYGAMLDVLRREGFAAIGCDVSAHACRFVAARAFGVVCSKTPGLPFARESFDFVISSHVIEHLADPTAFVREIVGLVRPGGCVALVTDHSRATQYAFEHARARLVGAAPPFRTSTDHTFVFRRRHLQALLTAAGCDIVRTRAYHHTPEHETWHWRAYKSLCRAVDRTFNLGHYQVGFGRRAPGPGGASA
jgi:2-polyprenyl-3-methyl-5-hydroxy-6-metoxy-1,4-benzoquinol methylase